MKVHPNMREGMGGLEISDETVEKIMGPEPIP